eukprot:scaffold194_cov56-Phaeocystis_antarctica.AAC.1
MFGQPGAAFVSRAKSGRNTKKASLVFESHHPEPRAHERPRALAIQSPGRERRRIQFASRISGARTQIRPSPCQHPWASVDPRSGVRASTM